MYTSFGFLMFDSELFLFVCNQKILLCSYSQKRDDIELPIHPPKREHVHMVPYTIRPVLQRTALEFLCWGVRNMEPFQLLSVDSPSVLIEVNT